VVTINLHEFIQVFPIKHIRVVEVTVCDSLSSSYLQAFDQLSSLQNDLAQDVKDFGAKLKQYTDDEIQAYEARAKASSADQR